MTPKSITVPTAAQRAKALARSDEQAATNNYPRLICMEDDWLIFTVSSRTTAGQVYLCQWHPDGTIICDCRADYCWHRMHVYRAVRDDIQHIDLTTGRPKLRYFRPKLKGPFCE